MEESVFCVLGPVLILLPFFWDVSGLVGLF